jgi:D-threo-aldose 1-dehydrogenase
MQAEGAIGAVSAGMNHSAPLARFAASGMVDCVMIAGRWTLLDQSAIDDLLPAASLHHVSVIAAGVFNSGVLADPDGADEFVNYFYRPAPPEIRDRVRRIRAVCDDHRVPLRAAALGFPLTHPAVATVCIGCRSAEEVSSNLEALDVDIPPALWHDLADEGLLRHDAVPSVR